MRRVLALALLIPLSGCATVQDILSGQSISSAAPQTMETAEKALTLSHLAYNGVGSLLLAAVHSGQLHGAAAITAKQFYDRAGDALDVADKADDAANTAGIVNAVNNANDLITETNALIKGK